MAAHELPEMPNGPVMELHGQRKRFHVPHGLKPLLEEITREILRYQPNDIYAFLSKFMESKLAKREAASKEKRNSGNRRWNSLEGPDLLDLAELDELLDELNISKDIADKHATKIQAAFRGHRARRSLTEKGKTIHKDHRKSWEWKKWSWEGPSTLDNDQLQEFLEELNVDLESANKHATKIQAAFRGHAVRRKSKEGTKKDDGEKKLEEAASSQPSPPTAEPATAEVTQEPPARGSIGASGPAVETTEDGQPRKSAPGRASKPEATEADSPAPLPPPENKEPNSEITGEIQSETEMSDNEAEMPSIASQDEAFTGDEEET